MAQTVEVIGIYDASGNQLFPDAESIRALVKPTAKVMKHPLESGASTVDHFVIEPVTIELSVIPKPETFQDTFQQIKAQFLTKTTVTVVTRADVYSSMLMDGYPYDETAEMFDTDAIGVKLTEANFVMAQYGQLPASMVKTPSNASTVKTGQKSTNGATQAQTSTAYDLIFGSSP